MKLINLFENEEITFRNEVTGYHHGQTDGILYAIINDEIVGYIDWDQFEGETRIRMIEVKKEHRRKGIGKKLVKELERRNEKVVWSGMTDDGSKLHKSMGYKEPEKTGYEVNTTISDLWGYLDHGDDDLFQSNEVKLYFNKDDKLIKVEFLVNPKEEIPNKKMYYDFLNLLNNQNIEIVNKYS